MYKIIVKENGKQAVVKFSDGDVKGKVIRNLCYAVGECMRAQKLTISKLAISVDSQPDLILRFLRADPELDRELPKRVCHVLNLDATDYPDWSIAE